MAFADIPERQNGKDQVITAEWFNTIRTELVNAFGAGGYIKETALQTISAGGEFTSDSAAFKEMMNIVSDGGTVQTSATPFGSAPGFNGGKEIILVGTSDTNIVEIPVSDVDYGFIGNGKIILSRFETVVLIYNDNLKRFFRQGDY